MTLEVEDKVEKYNSIMVAVLYTLFNLSDNKRIYFMEYKKFSRMVNVAIISLPSPGTLIHAVPKLSSSELTYWPLIRSFLLWLFRLLLFVNEVPKAIACIMD